MTTRTSARVLAAGLLVLTAACFMPVLGFEFLDYDDDWLVAGHPRLKGPPGLDTIVWAFTSISEKIWQPVVWLSYLADVTLFGMDSGALHRTNLLLHLVNVLLLSRVLSMATGRPWPSGLAAAIFALHPLQVETVAWVSERKGLLSGTFSLLAIASYVRHVRATERPGPCLGGWVPVWMSLAVMSKSPAVMLPVLLLALDGWPLGRLRLEAILEKRWLFALSLLAGLWTIAVYLLGEVLPGLDRVSLGQRLSNTVLSCWTYARKFFLPVDLRIPYQHAPPADPVALSIATAAAAALLGIAWWLRHDRPYVLAGLAWFIAGLAPVIGPAPVGRHWMADRYMYVPLIGLAVIVAFGAADLARARLSLVAKRALAASLVAVMVLVTRGQLAHWRSSAALFEHTLALDPDNVTARLHVGRALASSGHPERALEHLWRAVRLQPGSPKHHHDLGAALMMAGRHEEASRVLREAMKLAPGDPAIAYNLGWCLAQRGRMDEAARAYEHAVALDPTDPAARANLGAAYHAAGRLESARTHYRIALKHAPDHPVALRNLAALERSINQGRSPLPAASPASDRRPEHE